MKKALVTGFGGFVGRHLVPKLEAAGYEVFGTENQAADEKHILATKWDVVVHLAANIVNVDQRMNMGMLAYDDLQLDLQMCKWIDKNPPKEVFIAMSSCAVDFPEDPYCIVKRTLEAFCQTLYKRNVPVVILRPFSGYGADQSLEYPFPAILGRAKRLENPLQVWGGSQVRDWLHIDDLTDAIMYARDKFPRGVPIEVGTGIGTSLKELAEKMALAVGYTPEIESVARQTSSLRRVANPYTANYYGWKSTIALADGIMQSL